MVTDTQRAYLRAVSALTVAGRCTTMREVAARHGCKMNAAKDALYRLQRKGLVAMEPLKGRTMRLTAAGRSELAGLAVVDVLRISRGTLAQIEAEWAERRDAR